MIRPLKRMQFLVLVSFGFVAAAITFFPHGVTAGQLENSRGIAVTPSTSVLLIGETGNFSAVDASGLPLKGVQWSISPSIAEIHVEDGKAAVEAKTSGRAILTATAQSFTASAMISIVAEKKLPAGTVRWSVQTTPGFETLEVLQAVPNHSETVFYSIEWNKSANAIVRAINTEGQQLWMRQLSSSASPLTLKNTLPPPGEVFLNGQRISDHTQILIGAKNNGFAVNNSTNPSNYGLPLDGKSILLRTSGADSGGLILLERGRFRDSLVSLNPVDGSETWRYPSEGRLQKSWSVNYKGDIAIVEIFNKPVSSGLVVLNGENGNVRFKIPFPKSSSTINGFRCQDPTNNVLTGEKPSLAGSVFTSTDGNMYIQVEVHVESVDIEACKNKQYSFDDTLRLLRVTPEGEVEWKTFQHVHADGDGNFVVQPRLAAGESIPDGFGGVLAAWTYLDPHVKPGEMIHSEARLSRISMSEQHDFTLPLIYWTPGLNSFFDENMVLAEGNALYATNGPLLIRYDTQAGVLNWQRHPPTGEVKLDHSTPGGGVLVSNAGRLVYFDSEGNGIPLPWTVETKNLNDIGIVQSDLWNHTPLDPLVLREAQFCWAGNYIGVEEGAPYGRGALVYFTTQ